MVSFLSFQVHSRRSLCSWVALTSWEHPRAAPPSANFLCYWAPYSDNFCRTETIRWQIWGWADSHWVSLSLPIPAVVQGYRRLWKQCHGLGEFNSSELETHIHLETWSWERHVQLSSFIRVEIKCLRISLSGTESLCQGWNWLHWNCKGWIRSHAKWQVSLMGFDWHKQSWRKKTAFLSPVLSLITGKIL